MSKQTQQAQPEIMQPGHYDEDQEEGRLVENPNIQALAQLNSAEINQQIMTARAYPRSVTSFRRSMREMVTYDQPTALSCLYALKRSGKVIEGPSIRFAEAALQAWGNARAGARIVDIGDEFITAQGFFYDLEKNMALAFEVMRRITNKEGERYGDDMIGVTGNAACSIAIRNAILRGVPKTAWNESYQDARSVSIGKGESITIKREEMLKAFAPIGVDKEQIFGLLGVKGIDDVSIDQMIFMGGILNAIKEGETTVEKEFAVENMQNPDQVSPRRPRESEFSRKPAADPKPADAKPAGTGTAAPAAEAKPAAAETKPLETAASVAAGPSQANNDAAAAREDERQDFIKAAYAELSACQKVRDIPEINTRIKSAGVMTEKEEAGWDKDCDARGKEIMDKAKAARK